MMEVEKKSIKNEKLAAALSIIPGLGQLYNKQIIKGILFLAVAILFAYELNIFGIQAIYDLVTLGTTPI